VLARLRGAVTPVGKQQHHKPTVAAVARAWHGQCLPVYLGVAVTALVVSGVVLTVLACCYLALLRHALRARGRRHRTLAAQLLCSEACTGIADDLRAGRSGHLALAGAVDTMLVGLSRLRPACSLSAVPCRDCATYLRSIRSWRLVRQAAATDGVGVVAALRAVPEPHRFWCSRLAAAWQLHESGMALAVVLDGLDDELTSQRRRVQAHRVHTAAARATSAVLGCLPLLGLGVGYAMGADPAAVLLHTPLGACCALVAVLLHGVGWIWADRIAALGIGAESSEAARGTRRSRWMLVARRHRASRRLRALLVAERSIHDQLTVPDTRCGSVPLLARRNVRWLIAVLAGIVAGWIVGTPVLAVGAGCATAITVLLGAARLHRADERRTESSWLDQLPYALVLLSAVLVSGAATAQALCLVGRAVGDRLGTSLRVVGTAMAQGEPIPAAWQRGIAETAQTAPLLRALCRSDTSGAALAGTCRRLADQLREHAQAQAAVTAGRSAVLMIAPLMCCFLPAFVLLGVVPVVVSVLSQALGVAL